MKNQFEMTSPCRLACHAWILHRAVSDLQLAEQLAEQHDMAAEQIQFNGCRNHKGLPPVMGGQECATYACIT